jgi:hypothetical protein
MALRTACIAGARQHGLAVMFHMAAGAFRRERLLHLMNRTVMAGLARLIGYLHRECGLGCMTGSAVLTEDGVGGFNGTTGVDRRVPRHSMPCQPCQARGGKQDGEQSPPSGDGKNPLEIIAVDALCEILCGSGPPRHLRLLPLIAQRHNGVHSPKHKQHDRQRHVDQKPPVKPAVETNLPV